ncbi:ankyrin repeat domain-containing protein [Deinococcus sp. MIMF12]|uniref:Ankyrin repeat domain-containing protein n=1 Tax=Deinococcus rhizophilus TaxID=3049544 RepID=A0ABT7JIT2_9DEIO|nr:ankyrin repeat domain-containing protein [Deinococcus rhizophilus]MDL2343564.1 ankyrin repeat domain-containing protein [Deinococcus rhizophilus]
MTPDTQTALFQAIHANNEDGVRLLIGAEPPLLTARSPSGLSPVLFAAYYGRPRIVRLLLEAGAPLGVHEAAATGQLAALRAHLDADPGAAHALSPDGFPLLGLAALFGHEEAAAELLARGADVNRPSENPVRVRPLQAAAAGNHTALARRLIAAGADVNTPREDGFTPLMAAARNGNAELTEVLLAAGADPVPRTADGQDAADLAREEGHAALAGRLTRPTP